MSEQMPTDRPATVQPAPGPAATVAPGRGAPLVAGPPASVGEPIGAFGYNLGALVWGLIGLVVVVVLVVLALVAGANLLQALAGLIGPGPGRGNLA